MSGVDYSRLRSLNARRLIRALVRDGFVQERQRGSHRNQEEVPAVKFTYDEDADAVMMLLADAEVEETREIAIGVYADYDVQGRLIALEILDACKNYDLAEGQVRRPQSLPLVGRRRRDVRYQPHNPETSDCARRTQRRQGRAQLGSASPRSARLHDTKKQKSDGRACTRSTAGLGWNHPYIPGSRGCMIGEWSSGSSKPDTPTPTSLNSRPGPVSALTRPEAASAIWSDA